ncbi:Stonustoxin subunit beta [Folsomia candida]|uniref:Stonustoxin subunit beta n=1 Tax=Folsomia candida TaxID=158441 RepID=A0A226E9C1_FOLCA|nr:Stonustoxin subunit beta [Folsomia candida]
MKKFVEEDIIILPNIENGPVWIGDLWNCQDSSLVGSKLFSSLGELDVHPLGDYAYDLTHIKSTKDRIKPLNVEGSLFLELLSGLIKVEGSAKYDFEDKSSSLEEELVCRYSLRTFRVEVVSNAVINDLVRDKILRERVPECPSSHANYEPG